MANMIAKRRMINEILGRYVDFLDELREVLNASGLQIDSPRLRSEAACALDRRLSENELSALVQIEGALKGRFPGVENRIKELLQKEITASLLKRNR